MSHLPPLAVANNWNNETELAGAALCALGDTLQAVDLERLKCDCTLAGIGYLLNIVGGKILEQTYHVQQALKEAEAPPPT